MYSIIIWTTPVLYLHAIQTVSSRNSMKFQSLFMYEELPLATLRRLRIYFKNIFQFRWLLNIFQGTLKLSPLENAFDFGRRKFSQKSLISIHSFTDYHRSFRFNEHIFSFFHIFLYVTPKFVKRKKGETTVLEIDVEMVFSNCFFFVQWVGLNILQEYWPDQGCILLINSLTSVCAQKEKR